MININFLNILNIMQKLSWDRDWNLYVISLYPYNKSMNQHPREYIYLNKNVFVSAWNNLLLMHDKMKLYITLFSQSY